MPTTRTILLAAAILAGAALAWLSLPFVLRHAHDETARLDAILDACHSAKPRIVILGNSTGMFGVDARQLTRSLPSHPPAMNFCMPAQLLGEALLIERQLPPSTELVVQLVTFWQLEDAEVPNRLRTRERRDVRVALESNLRDLIRPDPDRNRGMHDLYFPAPRHPRESGYLPRQLLGDLEHRTAPYLPRAEQVRVLRAIAANRRVLFVLAPVHPRVRALRPDLLPRFRAAVASAGIDVLDLTELLDAQEFVDPTHATLAGAARMTDAIGRRIAID
ncbi:MAG TPA: hypothetical protein VN181_00720 [Thermoanaerobaculia bacterium]|nr:hypothetical protein [Thermoanaerobaculia bacterium]